MALAANLEEAEVVMGTWSEFDFGGLAFLPSPQMIASCSSDMPSLSSLPTMNFMPQNIGGASQLSGASNSRQQDLNSADTRVWSDAPNAFLVSCSPTGWLTPQHQRATRPPSLWSSVTAQTCPSKPIVNILSRQLTTRKVSFALPVFSGPWRLIISGSEYG